MKLRFFCLLTLVGLSLNSLASPEPQDVLAKAILNIKSDLKIDGELGVTVYSFKDKNYTVNIRDTALYTPASCLKLITTGAAFEVLPKNYFPKTRMEFYGKKTGRVFTGKLKIFGGGDPNISARYYSHEQTLLEHWINEIKSLGFDSLHGSIEVYDDYFDAPTKPLHWKPNHYNKWFGAEVSALSYNDNCFNLKVLPHSDLNNSALVELDPDLGYIKVINEATTQAGRKNKIKFSLHPDSNILNITGTIGRQAIPTEYTLPVRDPKYFFLKAFQAALDSKGIYFKEKEVGASLIKKKFHTFNFTSVPITNVLEVINQRSQNFYAETVLRHISKHSGGKGDPESGILQVKKFLHQLELDSSQFKLFDGSGLSPLNKVTPLNMVRFLIQMHKKPYFKDYLASLKVPGIHSGNLYRLSHLKSKIRIKTGYIDPVQGICGYIFTSENDTLAFSIFLNDYKVYSSRAVGLVDSVLTHITNWYNLEAPSLSIAEKLYQERDIPESYLDRLRYFSTKLEDSPYFLGPTGEGRMGKIDNKPLVDLSRFDCVTYIESVMALAMNRHSQGIIPTMNKIRYFSDTTDFIYRKHFFIEDWIKKGSEYVKTFRFPGDTTLIRTTGKKKFFGFKNMKYEGEDPQTELSYVPYKKALKLMDNWIYGNRFLGVGFVTTTQWLWVSHTGFLDAKDGQPPKLRHASSFGNKVRTENFKDYLLRRRGKIKGVFFFEFKDKPVL